MVNLINEIDINSLQEANEILKAAGTEDLFEKAHQDGEIHKNGKYVWVSSAAGGKGDWRKLNGRTHKNHQANNGGGGSATSSSQTTTMATKTSQNNVRIRTDLPKIAYGGNAKKDAAAIARAGVVLKKEGFVLGDDNLYHHKDGRVVRINTKTGNFEEIKEDASTSSVKTTSSTQQKKTTQATEKPLIPNALMVHGNLKMSDVKKLYTDYHDKYKLSSTDDLKKLQDKIGNNIQKQKDRYNRLKDNDSSKAAINKEGNALDDLIARHYTISRILSQPKHQKNLADRTTAKTTETKTPNSETYSHDINGVAVAVSKNKDGSYTLEANGKKVKSDDPSFFKDKLTPRVKKALAKEVGIDMQDAVGNTNSWGKEIASDTYQKQAAMVLKKKFTKFMDGEDDSQEFMDSYWKCVNNGADEKKLQNAIKSVIHDYVSPGSDEAKEAYKQAIADIKGAEKEAKKFYKTK